MHPAVDRGVLRRRLQVLADRHDVDAVRAQIAERVDNLVVRLAEPDDDPRLRENGILGDLLRAREQPERSVVGRLAAAHLAMQPAHRLDVVVEHVRLSADHGLQRLLLDTQEVGSQNLDRRCRQLCADRPDRGRIVSGALVGDVVAVD